MAKEEIEAGVTRMKPPKDSYGNQHSDIYLYQLDDMNDEAIARYGLTSAYKRYKARQNDVTSNKI